MPIRFVVRAVYCCNCRSHTENRTIIEIHDYVGVQRAELRGGLGPYGAVCVIPHASRI